VIGGDGAMLDIGFSSLSRMLASGMNIKVFVLDTQVYSNTGGQSSTGTFRGQGTKMSPFGRAELGKSEARKEIANIAMMHPNVYVAQTTAAHMNHFYRAVMEANTYSGPALISVYTTCQPEHGVGDHEASQRARAAVDSRAFPLLIHDPRKGDTFRERIDLKGNPAIQDDLVRQPEDQRAFHLHRLCARRRALCQTLRCRRQPQPDAAFGKSRAARQLAAVARPGRRARTGQEVAILQGESTAARLTHLALPQIFADGLSPLHIHQS
jgi:pyruvate/2-oxoacid:ferredoxin oxidoreductase beta subunit